MISLNRETLLSAGLLALGVVTGLLLGWKLWRPVRLQPETYARAQQQSDGSTLLERKPQPDATPAQVIPPGATVERIVRVIVAPHAPPVEPPAAIPEPNTPALVMGLTTPQPAFLIPPLRVDLTLVRLQDLSRRVIASSPDGTVIGGVDIPVEPSTPAKELKWAMGAVYGTTAWGDKAIGAFLDRDFAFLRTGAELTKNTYANAARPGWEFRAKFGIRF
jgi:hypothetical protein